MKLRILGMQHACLLFLALASCLFADSQIARYDNLIGTALREMLVILKSSETQWIVFIVLVISVFLFLSAARRFSPIASLWQNARLWGAAFFSIAAANFFLNGCFSVQALVLLSSFVYGQSIFSFVCLVRLKHGYSPLSVNILVVFIFVILLSVASIWGTSFNPNFSYHGLTRWSGPWDNPNNFGLLMGTGVLLALGLVAFILQGYSQGQLTKPERLLYCLFLFCTIGLMARGLLHSYSRGAWVATICGLIYLVVRLRRSGLKSIFARGFSLFHVSVVVISILAVCFFYDKKQNLHVASRALSAVNAVDFSWRNRIVAWEGALQVTAEHQFFGAGWNQTISLHENYYLPSKLDDGAAIEMNDYLMLAATLGFPALFCFAMYLRLSLARVWAAPGNSGLQLKDDQPFGMSSFEIEPASASFFSDTYLGMTCNAGAIVLLVGFWFDGGLFRLATASAFWILLEQGKIGDNGQARCPKTVNAQASEAKKGQ